MKAKAIVKLLAATFGSLLIVSEASAAFVDLPTARNTPGCGKVNSTLIRCGGVANSVNDPLYIPTGTSKGDGTYNFPSTLSLINQVDTNFLSGSGATYYSGKFSDYVFVDTTTNSVVIGSRLFFGTRPDGQRNIAEANDIFRYGYSGFTVQAGWTRLSDSDLRLYSVASSNKGLGQGADVYSDNVVDFRSDINASEGNPLSGLYLVRTNATAFKVISNAIEIRQGGEEGQSVLSVKLAGYAPTKLEAGVLSGETVNTYGGTYSKNMNVSGKLNVSYGNAQFNGEVVATSGSQINAVEGTTATFNDSFNQQVGAKLGGGGTFVFNGGYSAGNSPGSVAINGNVIFGSANEALFEIGGLVQGTEYDHVTVNGNLTFGGTLKLSFINGYMGSAGDTFDLFDFTTSTGAFSQIVALSPLSNGLGWSYDAASGVLTVIPVPEPSQLLMLMCGLGLAGFMVQVNKRRS